MNAPLSIFLNKTVFYNKKTAILYFMSLYFLVFLIFLDKGFETNKGNLFLISTLYFCISICLIKLIKQNNYTFHKFSFNTDEYKFSSRKEKMICYKESFNRLSKNNIQARDLGYNENETINKFLLNFNNTLNKDLIKSITFERFNDYFIKSKGNRTTGQLFYVQYRSSLVKIIKDFIIDTNELKDISNETISSFMYELTNRNNLFFDSNNGLHYNDKFVLEFLEKNNNQKTIIQENVTISENEQLKIKDISIFNFYRILSNSIKDVCNLKLNRKENREIKSFVGLYFKSDEEGTITFEKEFQKLSFTNEGNYKNFILILKYLTELHHVEIHESKLSRILKRCISEISFPNEVKDRTESIRQYYRNTDLSNIQKEKINSILQSFLNNKA